MTRTLPRRLLAFIKKCRNDNISAFAAQSAFFIILSMIPFLMLFISLVQYTPITESMIMYVVGEVMPDYISPFFVSVIEEMYTRSIGLISVNAVLAVWAAAKGMQYLTHGLNAVCDVYETRNYFQLRFRAMIYTLILSVVVIMALMLLVFGNSIQEVLLEHAPVIGRITQLILSMRTLIMLLLFIMFFAVIYKMLPNRKVDLKSRFPGSVLCALMWLLFSFGLSVYVDYFKGFSMYGSLTTIVLLMLWLYFGMYILLICAEINDYLEHRK